jgi:ABC-type methionine transport system permease subunit
MLMIILIVLFALAIGGGGWGHTRYGYAGWSPAGILLLVIAVLWLTGNLHS